MSFYTYLHLRADDLRVMYAGKGSMERAYRRSGRSAYWQRVARKHGRIVLLLAVWENEDDAFEHERVLIERFRRRGDPLVNLTDGGEGLSGMRFSPEHRARLSASNLKHSPRRCRWIEGLDGTTRPLREWAHELGVTRQAIAYRVKRGKWPCGTKKDTHESARPD
jgi:hypothetical protein